MYMQWWRNDFIRPRTVVGGAEDVWEWVRREWFRESIRARERRKEMNVSGAIRSCKYHQYDNIEAIGRIEDTYPRNSALLWPLHRRRGGRGS